jgi:DNA-directed RNA polymerase subunit RPC12/RpoP
VAVRYRCSSCGNRTRFDVESSRRTRAYFHYSIAGEPTVAEEEVVSEDALEVVCRWCGPSVIVEEL